MTRLEAEKEIFQMMGLLDSLGAITADANLRTYVQNKLYSALEMVCSEVRFSFMRQEFGASLKLGNSTGTIDVVNRALTGTVTGQTPDSTWVGGHVVIQGNGFPLRVNSVSGQVLTFSSPVQVPTNAASAFVMYFDGFLLPSNCQGIEMNTLKLAGHRTLKFVSRTEFDRRQGYWGSGDTDYGFDDASHNNIVSSPDVGQPVIYTSWGNVVVSGKLRRVINVYPYPDGNYGLNWDGWLKPQTLAADGDSPDFIPEQFHRGVWLIRAKLEMTEYPGFELSTGEKDTLTKLYTANLNSLKDACHQDDGEIGSFEPSAICQ